MKTRSHQAALCRTLITLLFLLVLAVALTPPAQAQPTVYPPGQISYQGFLVDANNIPLATNTPKNYDVIFRIYNVSTGGSPLWGELQTVTLDRGYFSVLLGQGSAVPGAPSTNDLTSLFQASDASDRYIGLTVKGLAGGDVEIQPRMRLLASPYSLLAHNANNASKLNGYDWNNIFPDTGNPVSGTFPGSKITAGSLTSTQIGTGAVGSAQIADGSVNTAEIATSAVGNAQIASGAIDGTKMSLPLYLSGSSGHFYSFGAVGMLDVNNTYTASFPYEPNYGIRVQGQYALEAYSPSGGTTAYLGDNSYAGYFYGNVTVSGTLSKTAGSFKIDHPLDPANKYLSHSFVESPDMKNIYDGVVTLDATGAAVVTFPAWFEALNQEFRYQLTSIGAPGPNLYVAEEVSGNHFKIAGGTPSGKVSWQVTGVRHDAYANAHRIPVEEDKPAELKGTYITPDAFNQPVEKSEHKARHSGVKQPKQAESQSKTQAPQSSSPN